MTTWQEERHPWFPPAMVYCIGTSVGRPVKLGYSRNPLSRLGAVLLHCPWPVRLLWAVRGDKSDEAALHKRYDVRRMHAEWFRDPDGALAGLHESEVAASMSMARETEVSALFRSRGGVVDAGRRLGLPFALYRFAPWEHHLRLPDDLRAAVAALPEVTPRKLRPLRRAAS